MIEYNNDGNNYRQHYQQSCTYNTSKVRMSRLRKVVAMAAAAASCLATSCNAFQQQQALGFRAPQVSNPWNVNNDADGNVKREKEASNDLYFDEIMLQQQQKMQYSSNVNSQQQRDKKKKSSKKRVTNSDVVPIYSSSLSPISVSVSVTNNSLEKSNPGKQRRKNLRRDSSDRPSSKLGNMKQARSSLSSTKLIKSRSSTMPGFQQSTDSKGSTSATLKTDKSSSQLRRYEGAACVPDSMIDFTREIHGEARITPAEEKSLGSKTQEFVRIQSLYTDLESELKRKPTDDEWCAAAGKINMTCLKQCLEEGKAAKDKLVVSNLRMVQKVVNLYIRNGLGSEYNAGDMMQEGTLALIRAAEKFDSTKGFRFSTYAMYGIRASIKRSQMLQSRIINIPQRIQETHRRVTKLEAEFKSEFRREPTDEEIASRANISVEQLKKVRNAMKHQQLALDMNIENSKKPFRNNKQNDLYEIIPDSEITKYANDATIREELINSLRKHLTPTEVKILCLRYGLFDSNLLPPGFGGPLTIREVGMLVGLKPDKVRRTINKSLRQLKYLIAHEWPEYSQEVLEEMKLNEINI